MTPSHRSEFTVLICIKTLQARNGTDAIARIVETIVHPQRFLDTQFRAEDAVAHINKYLAYDGFQLVPARNAYRLRRAGEPVVEMDAKLAPQSKSTHEFIEEQLAKCDKKLCEEDYDGAITNHVPLL